MCWRWGWGWLWSWLWVWSWSRLRFRFWLWVVFGAIAGGEAKSLVGRNNNSKHGLVGIFIDAIVRVVIEEAGVGIDGGSRIFVVTRIDINIVAGNFSGVARKISGVVDIDCHAVLWAISDTNASSVSGFI